MSVKQLYEQFIRGLPAVDRLRLAAMILDELAATSDCVIDTRDDWSAEDIADVTAYSLRAIDVSAED
jgi:hypothetical protein